ncbi:MAG: SUMF1/EgtB/PvdO family nonheme iron enzyme [Nitrospina sp.]|nr:SUMF1/EgtB/PvdO family nonheme iron enzyme [Nitrospina sp.]
MIKLFILFAYIGTLLISACGDSFDRKSKNSNLATVKNSPIDGKKMVLVPAGEFVMGTDKIDDEKTHLKIGAVKPLYLDQHPSRKIFLDSYYIDKYEVTNEEYKRFIDTTGYDELPGHWDNGTYAVGEGNFPVTHVTWREALTYALWAQKTLPTEAQWEKAARGVDGRLYPWGNVYEKGKSNMGIDGAKELVAGGTYSEDVSPYKVYDLGGNVMEWTMDWYLAYPGNTYKNTRYGKTLKVLRGNAFQGSGHYFLEAYRYSFARTEADPNAYFENVGFRCLENLKLKE